MGIILQVKAVANWGAIKEHRGHTEHQSNVQENDKQIQHPYQVRDKILIINKKSGLKAKLPSLNWGPFKVINFFINDTLKFKNGDTQK